MKSAVESTSTRPYLIRALYEWCADNGLTPYVAVMVDDTVQVPREHVKNGEIVLNISMDATSALKLGNEFIEFKARFGGVARDIQVPISRVLAIYARENGQGMAFEVKRGEGSGDGKKSSGPSPKLTPTKATPLTAVTPTSNDDPDHGGDEPPPKNGGRPRLTRIK